MKLAQVPLLALTLFFSVSGYCIESNSQYRTDKINCFDRVSNEEVLRSKCGGDDYWIADNEECYKYVPTASYGHYVKVDDRSLCATQGR